MVGFLQATGVSDKEVLRGVREDVGKMRYHIACNRSPPSYPRSNGDRDSRESDQCQDLSRRESSGTSRELRGVREDVGKMRYHIACNRVFEATHKNEIKKVKEDGSPGGSPPSYPRSNGDRDSRESDQCQDLSRRESSGRVYLVLASVFQGQDR
jgi:hypothetical protein